jgi:hypothetical protein
MSGWGSESWGADPWGSSFVAPPGPTPAGDGHIPLACNLAETGGAQIGGSELVQIEIQPVFDLTTYGKTTWKWHFLGEMFNLDAGKTVTIRIHHGSVFADPVVATVIVTANGPFHLTSSPGAIPAGAQNYFMSWQTNDTVPLSPVCKGMLVVVEVY